MLVFMDAGTLAGAGPDKPRPEAAADTLHAEVADALARGLVTPAEVAGIDDAELAALARLARAAYDRGDNQLAQTLACAQVVLAPYSAPSWSFLALVLQSMGEGLRASLASRAMGLLSPPVATADVPLAASQADAEAPRSRTMPRPELTLTDGRILPLRTTPAAQHHDTVAAQAKLPAILSGSAWVDAVQWATRTWEGPSQTEAQPAPVNTQTSIVRRPTAPKAPDAPGPADAGSTRVPRTQTDIIAPAAPQGGQSNAASRRLSGWPMTDEITLTMLPPRAKPGRKAP